MCSDDWVFVAETTPVTEIHVNCLVEISRQFKYYFIFDYLPQHKQSEKSKTSSLSWQKSLMNSLFAPQPTHKHTHRTNVVGDAVSPESETREWHKTSRNMKQFLRNLSFYAGFRVLVFQARAMIDVFNIKQRRMVPLKVSWANIIFPASHIVIANYLEYVFFRFQFGCTYHVFCVKYGKCISSYVLRFGGCCHYTKLRRHRLTQHKHTPFSINI